MSLIRTSLLNGIAVAVKVFSALVLNKILAVLVGPAGYAIIGQFQNVVSIIVSLAGGLVATGVTKTTAQHFDDEARQRAVWQTAIRFSLIASLLAGVSLLFMGEWLSKWLLHRVDMSGVFIWLALALPAMAANNLLLAVVNGKKEIGIYVAANITGSLASMLVTGLLAYYFGLYGVLVAFAINPAIVLASTAALVVRRPWFKPRFLWGKLEYAAARELSGFALMAVTSAMVVPATYMLIRDHLVTELGLAAAGYWQASWKISGIYLMMITSTLSLYYLPRLSEIRTAHELKAELFKVARFVIPVAVACALTVYSLRDFIVITLFTKDFFPMRELFSWQLAGDVIKMTSWVFGYIITARGLVKYYIVSEIYSCMFFVLTAWYFVNYFGLVGVSVAYLVTNCSHLILMYALARREIRRMAKL